MRQTILLADDSPTIRRLVTQTFADGNFRIVEVNNGDAAIKAFEDVRPNIVLADIYMPGKNGYQVCAYIRSHAELKRTPVILLVGAFEAFDEDTARQAGATANITKPFEPSALIELVKSILSSEPAEDGAELQPEPFASVDSNPVPEPVREPIKEPVAEPAAVRVSQPAAPEVAQGDSDDLLGLETIFREEPLMPIPTMITEQEIDRIADRVIQRLSTQVIESIAWDIVPDITEKIVREELKRIDEG